MTDAVRFWAEHQIECGFTPDEVATAVEEAAIRGIDVTKSDDLYSLEVYMNALDEETPPTKV